MSLKGIPAFYFPAVLASENDVSTFNSSGQRRDLNREKFNLDNLKFTLDNPNSFAHKNLLILNKYMKIRSSCKAFHPSSEIYCLTKGRSDIVIIKRCINKHIVFAIHNMTTRKLTFNLIDKSITFSRNNIIFADLISNQHFYNTNIDLNPYQVLWLVPK